MVHSISFTKASGAGNDFVLIDNMDRTLPGDLPALARALCSRPFGIGADGMLILEPSVLADFAMKYYNADGSYGGMCGNGGRCIARFARLRGMGSSDEVNFEALGHVYRARVSGGTVRLSMKEPVDFRSNIVVRVAENVYSLQFVNTGSPHAVIFTEDVEEIDVAGIGRAIRESAEFAPEGTNVNFVQRLGKSSISLRTYERGVEGETLACGTGSVASAVISAKISGDPSPVKIRVRSGERIYVHFSKSASGTSDIVLEGSAHILFEGNVLYDPTSSKIDGVTIL